MPQEIETIAARALANLCSPASTPTTEPRQKFATGGIRKLEPDSAHVLSLEPRYLSELATREVVRVFESVLMQVPGFIATSLVDFRSGMTLAGCSVRARFDLAAAGALNRELIKLQMEALLAGGSDSTIEDILLTLDDQLHILRMVDAGTSFIYLAADRSSTNLAVARYALVAAIDALLGEEPVTNCHDSAQTR